jgi:tetratricopeptide (TPR) repeat protein
MPDTHADQLPAPAAPPAPSAAALALLSEALAAHRAGQTSRAETLYRAVLAEAPGLAQAHHLCGILLTETGRPQEAAALLRQAAALRPGHADTLAALARAAAECGELPEAIALLQEVLATRPRDVALRLALAQLQSRAGDPRGALATARQAVGLAPDDPRARAALACHLVTAGQPEAALVEAEAGLARRGDMADAWLARGVALRALGRAAEAVSALERAASLAPDQAPILLAMANARADAGDTATALDLLRQAIAHSTPPPAAAPTAAPPPGLAEAYASLGAVLTAEGRLPEAVAACNSAIAAAPGYAPAHWNRAIARLLAGDLDGGFEDAEWRKHHPRFAADFAALTQGEEARPEWQGEPLRGRHLLVHAGQGMGDTLMFARYLAPLAARAAAEGGARVTLACAASLVPLLERHGIAAVPRAAGLPAHDLWIDQMSLARLLPPPAGGFEPIPRAQGYLTADPDRVAAWRREIGLGVRIGLVWAGNPAHGNDRHRSLPPGAASRLLRPLHRLAAAVPRLRLVALQHGPRHAELAPLGIPDLSPALTDWSETAALIGALDLVITVETAVAHLAGALGRPAWVMLPHAPDWRWQLARPDSPWYASLRLFRQPIPGDWDSTIRAAAAALRARHAPRDPGHP